MTSRMGVWLEPYSLTSVPALPLTSCDTLDKVLIRSKLQFPHQQKENVVVLTSQGCCED